MGMARSVLMGGGGGIMLKYSEAIEAVCDDYRVNLPNNYYGFHIFTVIFYDSIFMKGLYL